MRLIRDSGIFRRIQRDPRERARRGAEEVTGHPCVVADLTGDSPGLVGQRVSGPSWRATRLLALLAELEGPKLLRGYCAGCFGLDGIWAVPVQSPARDCGYLLILGQITAPGLKELKAIAAELSLELEAQERRTGVTLPQEQECCLSTRRVA